MNLKEFLEKMFNKNKGETDMKKSTDTGIITSESTKHEVMLLKFSKLFPTIEHTRYWKKGKNAIRIRTETGDLIFTFINDLTWKLSTIPMWESDADGI